MQISSVNGGAGLSMNSTYDTARAAADSARFSQALQEMQQNARADGAQGKEKKKLREACQGFEAMFLQMMYRQMRSTVPEDTLFGESHALKIFQDMRDDELMKKTAEAGGIGLGELLYKQLEPQVLAQAEAMQKQENR